MFLKNKTALITGSAKRTGRAIALSLAENGCNIIIHYNKSSQEANKVSNKIKSLGRNSIAMQADLTNHKDVQSMFKKSIN